MTAILTGDIVNSRASNTTDWLDNLKKVLNQYGHQPEDWEIYRGDSFQLKVEDDKALLVALHIKAQLKQSSEHDVRIAIGIGDTTYKATTILESNGSAFIHSGDCFEQLKKQTLAIKSGRENNDVAINIMLGLAMLTADSWSTTVALVIKTVFENPNKAQKDIAKQLGKSQSNISEALKRGGYDELVQLLTFYKKEYLYYAQLNA